ncbi:hypothetical protein [Streptomyces antibioticus]|uniref:hypothetical protein n=1 Tax=Streptomyces antibioticus TaxID=1890 RepID=UPI003D702B1E
MDLEKRPVDPERPEGCLVVAIRLPVRIVALVLVLPVRMAWDALVVAGRFLLDTLLRPVGRGLLWLGLWLGRVLFVWPLVGLWRYAVVPVGTALGWLVKVLVVVPAVWLHRTVLTPVGHGLAWLGRTGWAGLAWLGRGLWAGLVWLARGFGAGLAWVYARLMTPCGHAVLWLLRYLVVVPAGRLYTAVLAPVGRAVVWCVVGLVTGVGLVLYRLWRWVLMPVGRAVVWAGAALVTGVGLTLYWTCRVLFVWPAVGLWRWVLVPVGRVLGVVVHEVGQALGHAWRIAGRISLAVGRFLATLFRWIVVDPARWVYRTVLTPVGHVVRDAVLRPVAEAARAAGRGTRQALATARETVRQARADVRRALFGAPRERETGGGRELVDAQTRTLEKRTGREASPPMRG